MIFVTLATKLLNIFFQTNGLILLRGPYGNKISKKVSEYQPFPGTLKSQLDYKVTNKRLQYTVFKKIVQRLDAILRIGALLFLRLISNKIHKVKNDFL